MKESVTITREELHQLVWMEPGTRLAKQFGLSDTGLAKICRKLDVPRPPPGWWAKQAAGRAVEVAPLPDLAPGVSGTISITPTPESSGELREAISTAADRIGAIVVPERLTRAHPLIAGWRAERREQQAEAWRERDPWRRSLCRVADFTDTDRRRHRILHALFRSIEREGALIAADDHGRLTATLKGEAIAFELREKLRQVSRPLTDDERRWGTWSSSGVKKELEPTGFMQFIISA